MFAIVILSAWLVLADVRHAAFSVFAAVLSGGIGDAVVNCLLRVAILSLPLPIEAPVIPVVSAGRGSVQNGRDNLRLEDTLSFKHMSYRRQRSAAAPPPKRTPTAVIYRLQPVSTQ
jgi:hypothetical protein